MKLYANNYTMPLEHPDSSSPNPEAIPNSCWFCGFAPEGSESKDKDKDDKPRKCQKCGMLSLNTLPDDAMLTADPSAQERSAPSSFVVNVSHVKQAVDFSKGITPDAINQLKTELQMLGLPLDKSTQILRILEDYRALVQMQQQQMQKETQTTMSVTPFPTMKPPGGTKIKAADIVRDELKNKIEEVVEQLVKQGAEEDDAREMIKALVDKDMDVTATLDKLSVWAEPPVKTDFTNSLAESSKETPEEIRPPKKKVRRKKK